MTQTNTKQLIKSNTVLWITAMVMPAFFDLSLKALASGPVKFPWTITIPFLYVGLLLASNNFITKAAANADQPGSDTDG